MRALLFLLALCWSLAAGAVCTPGQGTWTINATSAVLKVCPADGSDWVTVGDSAAQAGATLPSGMIAAFNAACPAGWTELTAARGRVIVGVPAGGTLAGTVGTALTDLQDKSVTPTFIGTPFTSVINHTHPVTDPGHTHNFLPRSATTGAVSSIVTGTLDTSSTISGSNQPHVQSATTGITTANPVGGVASITPAGTVGAVTTAGVIAYIQYRHCVKD